MRFLRVSDRVLIVFQSRQILINMRKNSFANSLGHGGDKWSFSAGDFRCSNSWRVRFKKSYMEQNQHRVSPQTTTPPCNTNVDHSAQIESDYRRNWIIKISRKRREARNSIKMKSRLIKSTPANRCLNPSSSKTRLQQQWFGYLMEMKQIPKSYFRKDGFVFRIKRVYFRWQSGILHS